MKKLQQNCMLQLWFTPFVSVDLNTHFEVTFYNCSSADIVALATSRLCSRDPDANYMIPGFTMIRNDCTVINPALRPTHGLIVYLKDCIELHKWICVSEQMIELICLQIRFALLLNKNKSLLSTKHQTVHFQVFKTAFDKHVGTFLDNNKDFVILCDFNVDFNQHASDHCKWIENSTFNTWNNNWLWLGFGLGFHKYDWSCWCSWNILVTTQNHILWKHSTSIVNIQMHI